MELVAKCSASVILPDQVHVKDCNPISLMHDPSQIKLKTNAFGRLSAVKGMAVLHIAVNKKEYSLVRLLLEANVDVRD